MLFIYILYIIVLKYRKIKFKKFKKIIQKQKLWDFRPFYLNKNNKNYKKWIDKKLNKKIN